ncbi:MAG: TIGR04076 family protein [Candidatus Hodarchaeales archaeon]|jgi:uncharacterized repeat protein (TIGR04076 family)
MAWYEEISIEIDNILTEGECSNGHKKGDKFDYKKDRGRICSAAMNVLYPYILGLQSGGSFPWEDDPNSITLCCPDYKNPVVFKITRTKNTGK